MQMKDRLPQLRGEIKTKAQGAVSGIYGISSQLSKEEIETLVKMLLRKAAFTFRVPEKVCLVYFTFVSANNIFRKRVGIFANEIFALLLAQQWFDSSKKSSEGVGDYAASFNPIPPALIALIATAVECALRCWESGTYRSISFTDHDFAKVYRRHSKSLARFEAKQPANLQQLCRTLWVDAWYVRHLLYMSCEILMPLSGRALAGNLPPADENEDEDLDDADFEAEETGDRD